MKISRIQALIFGICLTTTALLLLFMSFFSQYIGIRVAPGIAFQILAPATLKIGEPAVITWDTSTEGVKKYPFEKIEFCPGKTNTGCLTLKSSIPNTGKAVVLVPPLRAKSGYIKITARDRSGKLLPALNSRRPVKVSAGKPKQTPVPEVQEHSSEGGSSSDGADDTPQDIAVPDMSPTPSIALSDTFFASPINGTVFFRDQHIPVSIKLYWSNDSPYTCATWLLDGKPVLVSAWVNGKKPSSPETALPDC